MAVNIHKGYPDRVLEDSYAGKPNENIVAGMMVFYNDQSQLQKGVGAANEYAMVAMNNQPRNYVENGGKIQVIKENASIFTDQFKSGVNYTPHCKLQVSVTVGEEGLLTIHANAGAPVIGRFVRFEIVNGVNMLLFDLVRN